MSPCPVPFPARPAEPQTREDTGPSAGLETLPVGTGMIGHKAAIADTATIANTAAIADTETIAGTAAIADTAIPQPSAARPALGAALRDPLTHPGKRKTGS